MQDVPMRPHDSYPLLDLASRDAAQGDLYEWTHGTLKRIPAIRLRSTGSALDGWSADTKLRLLEEARDMMEDFRLPDRSARAFRDLLNLRLRAERSAETTRRFRDAQGH